VTLTRADIEKVSLLARLQLTPDEMEEMTDHLGKIVGYVELLRELDTRDVEPMAHAMDLVNVFADDTLLPSLDREQALANAPKRDQECYRVPAVLGDES
jgi:aspartyl-tRNA(Asn)/glutamyl-tRNA(Gln) amidotransferase subunit C